MYKKYIPFLLLLISTLSFGQNIHFQAIGVEMAFHNPQSRLFIKMNSVLSG